MKIINLCNKYIYFMKKTLILILKTNISVSNYFLFNITLEIINEFTYLPSIR